MSESPDRSDLLGRLCDAIAAGQAGDPFTPVTVVVPSPVARVQLRRAVGARHGLCNVNFRTWGELVADLGRTAAGGTVRVPSPLAIDEALRQVLLGDSPPLGSFAGSPVARAEMVRVFTELWRAGPDLVAQLVASDERAQSLVSTLSAVEHHLSERGFTCPGRLLELAAVAPVDAAVSGPIIRWFPRAMRGRDRAVLRHLSDSGVSISTIETPAAPPTVGAVVACSDPEEEVRVICRRILGALEDGVPLWRQAIVHPPGERYRRVVHQQLAAAAIPCSGRSSMTLAHSATGRALLGALDLAAGAWRRDEVMRWLSVAPITVGPDAVRAPVSRWDDVSARAGVVEGIDQWRTRLPRFSVVGSTRDPYVAHGEGEAHSARALLAFIEQLAHDLETPAQRWSDWAAWAEGLLDQYLDHRDAPWPGAELAAAVQVRDAMSALGELDGVAAGTDLVAFRHMVHAVLGAQPVHDDRDIAMPASEADPETVSFDRGSLPGPVGSGVFVGTPTESRGLGFGCVYVLGAADQFLPGITPVTTLMADSQLDDPDWPTGARRARELLDDLEATLALAQAPVTFSWPLVDPRTGREHDRSRWLDPIGPLGGPWREETVPSFVADVTGPVAAAVPLSTGDRLLGDIARAVMAGHRLEAHPAVLDTVDRRPDDRAPPLRVSIEAALAPTTVRFSRFEGNVGTALARGVSGELSPTRLEQYAACPRRYLLDRELRLRAPFRPEEMEQMEARDRGTLVHEILSTYVQERLGAGAPRSLDRLMEIAEQQFSVAQEEGRCGLPLMAVVERANLMRDLRRFFEEDTLVPEAAELAFGMMGAAEDVADDRLEGSASAAARTRAVEVQLPGGRTVRFCGSVDRIDRTPDGTAIVVSDYKTGRQAPLEELVKDPVDGGTKLQLPIYALAAQAYLDWDGPVLARYWNISWERSNPSFLCAVDDRLLDRFGHVVSTIAGGIEAGVFPGNPGEETYRGRRPTFEHCVHCDFDSVCPTDRDRRWAVAQTAPETAPVVELAERPGPELAGIVAVRPVDLTRPR